jgi:uncharacterized protein YyaL (SSP411 family)
MDQPKSFKNHLSDEKSPYLLQHANNPVDWYPWGDEAFEKAKKEDKPLFLSIGYSTCHWCHVMARESFQDPEIGELLNQYFVSVKVDREERPDLDHIYMTVCQIITGSGGWPLTIILTPDRKPFFAGTYFPKESNGPIIGLKDLLHNVTDMWHLNREQIIKSADDLTDNLSIISKSQPGKILGESVLENAYKSLLDNFDRERGGFGGYQKFPTPHNLLFLLRYWKSTEEEMALSMVEDTLQSMMMGGIWDHVGYGFHRYTVDPDWLVPHFEKMLYDQALICIAYTEAYQATDNQDYRNIAEKILEYVLRDMRSPSGGFYSAEDADSEGVEGKYYLWSINELNEVLTPYEVELVERVYNIHTSGNFQEESTGQMTGSNILHIKEPLNVIAESLGFKNDELDKKLEKIRLKLYQAREERVHPHKDDKILTDWNGLIIASLAKLSRAIDSKEYRKAAEESINFIQENLYLEGKLWHRYRDGEVKVDGNLDDYAYMVWGLLELFETTQKVTYLKFAYELNQKMIELFYDSDHGGFFFTSEDVKDVLVRKKESYDSAIPSGNSIAYLNLLRLSTILEDDKLEKMANSVEKCFSNTLTRSPSAHTMFLSGLDYRIGPSYGVVVAGEREDDIVWDMFSVLGKLFLPNMDLVLNQNNPWLQEKIPLLSGKNMIDKMPTVYVCGKGSCYPPVRSVEGLLAIFENKW